MTEQLHPKPADRVLEIGTGSGYQAAVLSRLVAGVYTIEIIEPLAKRAEEVLEKFSGSHPLEVNLTTRINLTRLQGSRHPRHDAKTRTGSSGPSAEDVVDKKVILPPFWFVNHIMSSTLSSTVSGSSNLSYSFVVRGDS
jgi:tRNA A58 N-methylase Trm61